MDQFYILHRSASFIRLYEGIKHDVISWNSRNKLTFHSELSIALGRYKSR